MEKRRLGRTGHESTIVTFGAISVGKKEDNQEMADEAIEMVLQHGINHFDIAPGYGLAMERVAPWMPKIRDKIFLGAKTTKRTRDEARESIDECMKRLNVDKFDLFQHHGIGTMEELDKATAPGGALEALIELREQGGTKWLGITGHGPDAPKVHLEALRRFDFDTIMFPVSAAIFRNDDYRRDAEALFAEAHRRDVGIQTIKMLARGGWGDHERDHPVWYDPHRDQDEIDKALWWQQSQPIHTAPSTGSLALLPKILDAAERFRPLSPVEQQAVLDSQSPPHPEPGLGIPAAA
jgi:aryl-alcohol dehydrogenase-like predicted oxidoreductase